MLIAVSADGRELSSAVSEHFEDCRWLLFLETDDDSGKVLRTVDTIKHSGPSEGMLIAGQIIERDCEAVITGTLTPKIFEKLAGSGITRYCGWGLSVGDAILSMNANTLPYIRFADENDTCHGDHSGGECNCGEEHD
jgi:predicted Fe-Mo cluster-binding NifX family protein